MQFSVSSGILTKALEKVSHAIELKGRLPSYANVRLEAANNVLVVSVVGELSFCIEDRIPADTGSNHFLFGVSGKLLKDIVSSFPDQLAHLMFDKSVVRIDIGKNTFKLNAFDSESFLDKPKFDSIMFEQVNVAEFLGRAAKVSFCTAKGDELNASATRYTCIGINPYHFVATNGNRMAIHDNKLMQKMENKTHLLSFKTLGKLNSVFNDVGESGGIFIDQSSIYMASGGLFASARLSNDDYPNYTSVIPKTPFEPITFVRKDLERTLYRSILLADEKAPHASFTFKKEGEFNISSTGKAGESVQTIGCETKIDSSCLVNAEHFVEAIKHMRSEKITMEYRGPNDMILMTEEGYVNIITTLKRDK